MDGLYVTRGQFGYNARGGGFSSVGGSPATRALMASFDGSCDSIQASPISAVHSGGVDRFGMRSSTDPVWSDVRARSDLRVGAVDVREGVGSLRSPRDARADFKPLERGDVPGRFYSARDCDVRKFSGCTSSVPYAEHTRTVDSYVVDDASRVEWCGVSMNEVPITKNTLFANLFFLSKMTGPASVLIGDRVHSVGKDADQFPEGFCYLALVCASDRVKARSMLGKSPSLASVCGVVPEIFGSTRLFSEPCLFLSAQGHYHVVTEGLLTENGFGADGVDLEFVHDAVETNPSFPVGASFSFLGADFGLGGVVCDEPEKVVADEAGEFPDGYCYLRAIKESCRQSVSKYLGCCPTLQQLICGVEVSQLDQVAARTLGLMSIPAHDGRPDLYHLSCIHAWDSRPRNVVSFRGVFDRIKPLLSQLDSELVASAFRDEGVFADVRVGASRAMFGFGGSLVPPFEIEGETSKELAEKETWRQASHWLARLYEHGQAGFDAVTVLATRDALQVTSGSSVQVLVYPEGAEFEISGVKVQVYSRRLLLLAVSPPEQLLEKAVRSSSFSVPASLLASRPRLWGTFSGLLSMLAAPGFPVDPPSMFAEDGCTEINLEKGRGVALNLRAGKHVFSCKSGSSVRVSGVVVRFGSSLTVVPSNYAVAVIIDTSDSSGAVVRIAV